MGLLNSAQEIRGEKRFLHRATFEGDVVHKRTVTAYSPVPIEPSLGNPHYHLWNSGIVVPANNTAQTLSLSGQVPPGTKAVFGRMNLNSTGAGEAIQILDSDAATVSNQVTTQVSGVVSHGTFLTRVDSSGNMYWKTTNRAVTSGVGITITFYYI